MGNAEGWGSKKLLKLKTERQNGKGSTEADCDILRLIFLFFSFLSSKYLQPDFQTGVLTEQHIM